MVKTITVAMHKGGVGKTAIATNLAGLFSMDYKVLLIDLDSQGNVSRTFHINQNNLEYTVTDLLLGKCEASDVLLSVNKSLDILPANIALSSVETLINRNADDFENPYEVLKEQLDVFKEDYDYIIIDTPPSTGLIQGNALTVSDYVLIPLLPERLAASGLMDVIDTIEVIQNNINPHLKILGVVSTLVMGNTRLHKDIIKQTKNYCDIQNINMFNSSIPRSIKFAENDLVGLPITLNKKADWKLRNSYKKLYKEICSVEGVLNDE